MREIRPVLSLLLVVAGCAESHERAAAAVPMDAGSTPPAFDADVPSECFAFEAPTELEVFARGCAATRVRGAGVFRADADFGPPAGAPLRLVADSRESAELSRVTMSIVCDGTPGAMGRIWFLSAPGAMCNNAGFLASECDNPRGVETVLSELAAGRVAEMRIEGAVAVEVEVCTR